MQFKNGASVVNAQGDKVGEIDRVVIDPQGGEVTHIVIRKGFLLPTDKVVPVDLVHWSHDEEVAMKAEAGSFDELPDFQVVDYLPLDEEELGRRGFGEGQAPPIYWYPMVGTAPLMWGGGYWGHTPASMRFAYAQEVEQNIPEGTIALKQGAQVLGHEGDDLGRIDEVIVDRDHERVTHMVVTKGTFDKSKKLIPAAWIERIKEDAIQLSVNARVVEQLKEYQG